MVVLKQATKVVLADKAKIGARLRAERERLGLTQQALAAALDVQRQAIVSYEAGGHTPDAAQMAAFDRLGGDAAYVVSGRRSDEVSESLKLELELAMETAEKMCRDSPVSFTVVQVLRLAFEIMESVRRAKGSSANGS